MNKLKDFMNILTGSFNNSEQFDKMKLDNIDFPYAEHVNTICNDKIINLPEDFKGIFMVEESYYTSMEIHMLHLTYFYLHKKKMELN